MYGRYIPKHSKKMTSSVRELQPLGKLSKCSGSLVLKRQRHNEQGWQYGSCFIGSSYQSLIQRRHVYLALLYFRFYKGARILKMLRQSVKILIEQRFRILIPEVHFPDSKVHRLGRYLHKRQCWQQRK